MWGQGGGGNYTPRVYASISRLGNARRGGGRRPELAASGAGRAFGSGGGSNPRIGTRCETEEVGCGGVKTGIQRVGVEAFETFDKSIRGWRQRDPER